MNEMDEIIETLYNKAADDGELDTEDTYKEYRRILKEYSCIFFALKAYSTRSKSDDTWNEKPLIETMDMMDTIDFGSKLCGYEEKVETNAFEVGFRKGIEYMMEANKN